MSIDSRSRARRNLLAQQTSQRAKIRKCQSRTPARCCRAVSSLSCRLQVTVDPAQLPLEHCFCVLATHCRKVAQESFQGFAREDVVKQLIGEHTRAFEPDCTVQGIRRAHQNSVELLW